MDPILNDIEARIIGCLIEKDRTTPDHYPLSLNALTNACNQKSNRDPVMDLDEQTVQRALDQLRPRGFVVTSVGSGSRVEKYRHLLPEKLDLLADQTAILCELMLRGPQTVGELRTRCQRLHEFRDIDDVADTLAMLAGLSQPMVQELPRLPGQKEPRWAQLLTGPVDLESLQQAAAAAGPARAAIVSENQRIDVLESRIDELTAELEDLKSEFTRFREQFE